MAMDNSVICLGFSRDSELLVSGSTDGKIAVSFFFIDMIVIASHIQQIIDDNNELDMENTIWYLSTSILTCT